jgi:hypothetical protein
MNGPDFGELWGYAKLLAIGGLVLGLLGAFFGLRRRAR